MKRGLHLTALFLFCILFTISCNKDDEHEEPEMHCLLDSYQEGSFTVVYAYDANDRLIRVDYHDTSGHTTVHKTNFLDLDEDGFTDRIEEYYADTLLRFTDISYEDHEGGEIAKGKWEYTGEEEDVEYEYEFDEQERRVKYINKVFDPGADFVLIVTVIYTWKNDNMVKLSYQPNYTKSRDFYYEYDKRNNPYYHFDKAWVISEGYRLYPRSKNNPVKIKMDYDVIGNYSYTYGHHNYPISVDGNKGYIEYSYTSCESLTGD